MVRTIPKIVLLYVERVSTNYRIIELREFNELNYATPQYRQREMEKRAEG